MTEDSEIRIAALLAEAEALAAEADIEGAQQRLAEADRLRTGAGFPKEVDEMLCQQTAACRQRLNEGYRLDGFGEKAADLRVDYVAPVAWLQSADWHYGVAKFPAEETIVFPYRRRMPSRTRFIEKTFVQKLQSWLPPQVSLLRDACLNITESNQPYELNMALLIAGRPSVRIDVEIDEPYVAVTRKPRHYVGCGDDYRDGLLTRHGWIVVRLAERQVWQFPRECARFLFRIIQSVVPEITMPEGLEEAQPLPPLQRWTRNQALMMAACRDRESYLRHTFAPGEEQQSKLPNIPKNAHERRCSEQVKPLERTAEMCEKMDSFTDAGRYEQDLHIDFLPEEHIYTYRGQERLLPVSSLIGYFFDEFDALSQAEMRHERQGIPVAESLNQWSRIGKMASEVGTFVHLQTENYFQRGFFETSYSFEFNGTTELISVERERQHFLNFIHDYAITPYRQEWPVYDADMNVAGTIDMICREDDGMFTIYDWKRSSKVVDKDGRPIVISFGGRMGHYGLGLPDTAYYHYCLQQNLYRYMLEKNYGIRVKAMNLVVLCPDYANYRLVSVPVMDEVIGRVVALCKEEDLGHRLL